MLGILVLLAVVGSSSTSMEELALSAMSCRAGEGGPAPQRSRQNNMANVELFEEDPGELLEKSELRGSTSLEAASLSSRGTHDRTTAAKREAHADQARTAFARIESTALADCCEPGCHFKCADALSRNEMFTCHESSYGTTSWISDSTLQVSRVPRSPVTSFAILFSHCSLARCAIDREAEAIGGVWQRQSAKQWGLRQVANDSQSK